MNIEASTIVGITGTVLAFIEIWKPKICLAIEGKLDQLIEIANEYSKTREEVTKEAKRNGAYAWEQALKGPQLKPFKELKAEQYMAIDRYRSYKLAYAALISDLSILKPIKLFVSFLNFIGKGKAVGGTGIILNIVGLCLG